jgi:Circularly permutated YpsA SLOG family
MKIISGGQTGVDRAALDTAIALGLAYGGWCPRGGWAEDLQTPPGLLTRYPLLRETPSKDPARRTRWNVRDSDRTLILHDARGLAASRGTALTLRLAEQYGKLHLVVDVDQGDAADHIMAWLANTKGAVALNIAGPRESSVPGIYEKTRAALGQAFGSLRALEP